MPEQITPDQAGDTIDPEETIKNAWNTFTRVFARSVNKFIIVNAELRASYTRKELRELNKLYRRRKRKPNPNRGIRIRIHKDGDE